MSGGSKETWCHHTQTERNNHGEFYLSMASKDHTQSVNKDGQVEKKTTWHLANLQLNFLCSGYHRMLPVWRRVITYFGYQAMWQHSQVHKDSHGQGQKTESSSEFGLDTLRVSQLDQVEPRAVMRSETSGASQLWRQMQRLKERRELHTDFNMLQPQLATGLTYCRDSNAWEGHKIDSKPQW